MGNIVYTGGTMDLLHAGHIDLLRVCRKMAGNDGRVVVALNRDEFIEQFKGTAPVCSYTERREMLLACRYVDDVVENFGDQDSTAVIDKVKPDFVVIGDDWATRDYYSQMGFSREWLIERGITLIYVARQRQLSSTLIKERTHGQLGTRPVPAQQGGPVASPTRITRPSP